MAKPLTQISELGLPEKVLAGLARVTLALKSESWARSSAEGLNPTQIQIIATLQSNSVPLSLSRLAEHLGSTKATASDSVSSLEAKGYLIKQVSEEDSRRISLTLSPAGRRMARKLGAASPEMLAGLGILKPEEQAQLLGLISKLILGLQAEGRIAPSRMCVSCRFFRENRYPDSPKPHHCDFVDSPFGNAGLRLDCGEHQART
jgi:DNA-binding MarR family transcriptional regulator